MELNEAALLVAGGFVAGIINTIAGGGSLLTVPLLVMTGYPGVIANATNRVGVLVQSGVASWRFGAEGVPGWRAAAPIMIPLLVGSTLGALVIADLSSAVFEKVFGIVMLIMLVPALRPPKARDAESTPWPAPLVWIVFFVIGVYGGAIQAGVGIVLVLALSRSGHDLVLANSVKSIAVAAFTLIAVVVFVYHGQVRWLPAAVLATSQAVGATVGARMAVRGGERVVRVAMTLAVIALAGRMLAVY